MIGKAGGCHGQGPARSVGTDHRASTKPRPHSSSARWKGVAAPLRTAIPRRPSLRQFPPQAPMRQVDAPARIDDYQAAWRRKASRCGSVGHNGATVRSEEHTSELQSLMRISYAVFCLKKKTIESKMVKYVT